ncbi:hypothetical protein RUM43_002835 [Polyplax serrata]|uniref:Uncharacterized protein n=1 Tax=Polyplax serrata TaxID=468196 RepID=A0AAN8RW78_POLSC
MSTFLFTLLGLTVGTSYHCAVRREIAPCSCRLQEPKLTTVVVACEQMPSFSNIIQVLQNRFSPEQDISLKISFSHLSDMKKRSFKELGMSVSNLNLNFDDISHLPESSFKGLEEVEYLSLADNRLLEIPRSVLRTMPKLKTLDLGRSRIANLLDEDFADLPTLRHLLLPGNMLAKVESNALPRTMRRIHLGRNSLKNLNGSLRALTDLEWLFINGNQLTTLYEQLPQEAPKLILLHAAHNLLTKLPVELKNYPIMGSLFFYNNNIVSLDRVLQKSRRLRRLHLTHNKIHTLADDEFAETELMDDIQLGHNHLKNLNKAFLPMRRLRSLNLTHNHLEEFSFEEIRGLQNLKILDLSYNRIKQLSGKMENTVELETRVEELRLEHNEITALEGSLMGIHGLQRLNLSHNKLMTVAPDDLIGLEDLTILDVSHNLLQTLDETSKTFLPNLEELIANNNWLKVLDKDFHGLPVLCKAELSGNQIHTISSELISKSRCKVKGVYGILRIYLHDNPVLCHPDFNATAEQMEANATKIHGDFSICPLVETSTESLGLSTTTVNSTTPTMDELNGVNILPVLRANSPEALPLLFNSRVYDSVNVSSIEGTNDTQTIETTMKNETYGEPVTSLPENSSEPSKEEQETEPSTTAAGSTSTTTSPAETNDTLRPIEGNLLHSMIMHPPVIFKDEGSNITLVIPVKDGVVKQDHVIDQYTQNSDGKDVQDQSSVSSSITNIEIVEIKQLPNDSSLVSAQNNQSHQPTSD